MIVFLDTNVFLYGLKDEKSNSRKVLDLAEEGKIKAVVSELVLEEVSIVFERLYGVQESYLAAKYAKSLCSVISRNKILKELKKFRGKIKEKDLENLATVKALKINFLVSFDRDYKEFEEHFTPKQFLIKIGWSAGKSEY